MSNYKGIKGFQIQTRTEDPTPYAQALADNPYAGTWASGGDMNHARKRNPGAGTQTSSVVAGGDDGGSTPTFTEVEEYNGTSWTEIAEINEGNSRQSCAGANAEAILEIGGEADKATCESWNGSAWTEVGDLNTGRYDTAAGGPYTSAIVTGGSDAGSPGYQSVTETWDGSSWTETGDLNTARQAIAGDGTTTAMIVAGGTTGSNVAVSETFNGSTWTEVNDLNTARHFFSGSGSTTNVIVMGGNPRSGKTENYDGSSWSEVNDLATARDQNLGRAGTGTLSLMSGGATPSVTAATEEWSFSGIDPSTTPAADYADAIIGDFYYNSTTGQFKNINDGGPPIGTFSSGGNLPTNYINQGAFGGRDSVTTGGGSKASGSPARVGDSFQYDGASWSEIAELNTGRDQGAGLGTQNSGLVAAGYRGSPTATVGICENWNGSSWTEIADVTPVRTGAGTAGVYTAGLIFGGNEPNNTTSTMTWNGSTWTEVNDLNDARSRFMGQAVGTSTAALAMEGEYYPNTGDRGSEEWDGSSWTSIANMNTARQLGGGSGITTLAIAISGRTGAPGYNPSAAVESWNGTAFTEVADVSSARAYLSSAGTAGGNPGNTSIIFGGATTSSTANTAATEEWNAADFQIKTVTTS